MAEYGWKWAETYQGNLVAKVHGADGLYIFTISPFSGAGTTLYRLTVLFPDQQTLLRFGRQVPDREQVKRWARSYIKAVESGASIDFTTEWSRGSIEEEQTAMMHRNSPRGFGVLPPGTMPPDHTDLVLAGRVLTQWHSAMGDPIYMVGSYYFDGRRYPDHDVLERAIGIAEGLADREAKTAKDKKDLRFAIKIMKRDLENKGTAMRQNSRRDPADEHAAEELKLYLDNEATLSPQGPSGQGREIAKNLLRKMKAGKYEPTKAPKLWGYLVEAAAKKYAKEFDDARRWASMFNPATRDLVAVELAREFEHAVAEGAYEQLDTRTGYRPNRHQSRRAALRDLAEQIGREEYREQGGRPTFGKGSRLNRELLADDGLSDLDRRMVMQAYTHGWQEAGLGDRPTMRPNASKVLLETYDADEICNFLGSGDGVDGGYVVFNNKEGEPVLMAWDSFSGEDDPTEFTRVYTVPVADDTWSEVGGTDWDWKQILRSVGPDDMSVEDLPALGRDPNVCARVGIYQLIADYHGWIELDNYPQERTLAQLARIMPDHFDLPEDEEDEDDEDDDED
jgi:hypothetical protein